jgi:hypothetical protein
MRSATRTRAQEDSTAASALLSRLLSALCASAALYESCWVRANGLCLLVPALAHLRDEGGVVGSAPPLLGAARAPQGFLADTGFTPAAAGAVNGLMLVPVGKHSSTAKRKCTACTCSTSLLLVQLLGAPINVQTKTGCEVSAAPRHTCATAQRCTHA